jgi:hypothetical protein
VGAWGTALFSDDLAAGIREDWRDYIGDGMTPDAATQLILADYDAALHDQDEAGVVWLALAVSQWRTGRTIEMVLRRAIEVIDSGSDLRRWEWDQQPRQAAARAKVLAKTRELLVSRPPEPKRIPQRKRSKTPYGPGDLLAYRHRSGRKFAFWVVRNWSDKGGEYNTIDVLDCPGATMPPVAELIRLPALTLQNVPSLGIGPTKTELAGLTLINAAKIPAARISLLGKRSYPSGRPKVSAYGASAKELDDLLDRFIA